jgi:hypothetical protein
VWQTSMKKSLVKEERPFGKGDAWIEVTSSHFAFVDFRAHPDGIECLRVPTGTNYEKRRAVDALRSVADFLESKMDAAEVSPCDLLPSCEEPNHPANRREGVKKP